MVADALAQEGPGAGSLTPGRKYLAGVLVICLVAFGITRLLAPATQLSVRATLAMGGALQLPLGWWLVRSVGSQKYLLPWVLGMLARLLGLGLIGLLVVPAQGWDPRAPLFALVLFFSATLAVEGLVLWTEHFGTGAR